MIFINGLSHILQLARYLCGMNQNGFHMLMDLNTWSPVSENI